MGTDLDKTIENICENIEYYILCCNPKNKEDIQKGLDTLCDILNKNNK